MHPFDHYWKYCPECKNRIIHSDWDECEECATITRRIMTGMGLSFVAASVLLIIILFLFGGCAAAAVPRENALLDAIAVLESQPGRSDGGRAHGVFQMHARAFLDVQRAKRWSHDISEIRTNAVLAREYAREYLRLLHDLLASGGCEPTPTNLWAAWNLGPTRFRARGYSLTKLPRRTADGVNYINARLNGNKPTTIKN